MTVHILCFGVVKEICGAESFAAETPEDATVASLLECLRERDSTPRCTIATRGLVMRPFLFFCFLAFSIASSSNAQQSAAIAMCGQTSDDYTLSCPFGSGITSLIQGADGNLYGTASGGGANGFGTVFRMSPLGSFEVLHSFCSVKGCPDGAYPNGLIQGADGNFYGTTTEYGGVGAAGEVFRISSAGSFTVLYSFCTTQTCPDGGRPIGGVIEGTDGKFYGANSEGGSTGCGVLYSVTSAGVETTLASVPADCIDGAEATGSLVQASDGNFYGTTSIAFSENILEAPANFFELSLTGGLTSNTFCCSGQPVGALVEAADGQLYGATYPAYTGGSEVYSITTGDIAVPNDDTFEPPIALANGSLLVTESEDSDNNDDAALVEVTPTGSVTTLYSSTEAAYGGPVVLGSNGNVYIPGGDEIYDITPASPITPGIVLTASKTSLTLGQSTTLQWTVKNAFSDTLMRCAGFLNGASLGLVPLSGTYQFKPAAAGSYVAGITCGGTESGTATIDVTNGAAFATTTAVSVSPNPQAPYNTVVLTASVTRKSGIGSPSGVVTFYSGSKLLGSAALMQGSAMVPVYAGTFPPSSVPIVAEFSGDVLDSPSTSPSVDAVFFVPTSVSLSAAPNVVEAGQSVTLSATVNGDNYPYSGGTVKFFYGSTAIGQAPLVNNVAAFTTSTAGIPSGIYPITAVYEGTPNFGPSMSGPANVSVDAQ